MERIVVVRVIIMIFLEYIVTYIIILVIQDNVSIAYALYLNKEFVFRSPYVL